MDRQAVFSVPEGGAATFTFPEFMSEDTIQMLEELALILFRGLRRSSIEKQAKDAGETEYASWTPNV